MIHLLAILGYAETHLIALALAGISSFVLGMPWYGPLFGKPWMEANKIQPPKPEDMKFSMMLPGIAGSVTTAVVQAAFIGRAFQILQLRSPLDAIAIATLVWLPFTGLTFFSNYIWVGRPMKLSFIDGGFYLVSLWVISLICYVTL